MRLKRKTITPIEFVRDKYPHDNMLVWYQGRVVRRVDRLAKSSVTCQLYCGDGCSPTVGKYEVCLVVEPLNYSRIRDQCQTLVELIPDGQLLELLRVLRLMSKGR